MARGKVAPLTHRWLTGNWCEWEPLAEEVRALLAVERAAALLAAPGRSPDRTMDDLKSLRRALARLRRVGGKGAG
jgi:hypothetical protein